VFTAAADGLACDDTIACSQGDACRAGQCKEAASACAIAETGWPVYGHDAEHTSATALLGPSGPTAKRSVGVPRVGSFVIASDGTIYATGDGQVRRITPDGIAVPFAAIDAHDLFLRKDGGLYVRTSPNAALESLDASGTPVWTFDASPMGSPAFGSSGAIYAAGRFSLFALRPDGSTLWSLATGGSEAADSPVVGPDGTVYALAPDLVAIDPAGRVKWKRWVGWGHGLAMGRTGSIFVLLDRSVRAVDPTGTDEWTWSPGGPATTFMPGIAPSGDLILTTGSTLYRLDPSAGTLRSSFSLPPDGTVASRFSSAVPPVIDGNDVVFVVANAVDTNSFVPQTQATLYALDPSGSVLWSTEFARGMSESGGNLAIGPGGILYLTVGATLFAIGP